MSTTSLHLHLEPEDEIAVEFSLEYGTANEVNIRIGAIFDMKHVVMSSDQADDLALKLRQAAANVRAAQNEKADAQSSADAHQEVTG